MDKAFEVLSLIILTADPVTVIGFRLINKKFQLWLDDFIEGYVSSRVPIRKKKYKNFKLFLLIRNRMGLISGLNKVMLKKEIPSIPICLDLDFQFVYRFNKYLDIFLINRTEIRDTGLSLVKIYLLQRQNAEFSSKPASTIHYSFWPSISFYMHREGEPTEGGTIYLGWNLDLNGPDVTDIFSKIRFTRLEDGDIKVEPENYKGYDRHLSDFASTELIALFAIYSYKN